MGNWSRLKLGQDWRCEHRLNTQLRYLGRMALFHLKQTRESIMEGRCPLRVKSDDQLMKVIGERKQNSCITWAASAKQERCDDGCGGGGGGQAGRDVQLAGVDLGLVMIHTVGEEMEKIQQERNQWIHRMSGS